MTVTFFVAKNSCSIKLQVSSEVIMRNVCVKKISVHKFYSYNVIIQHKINDYNNTIMYYKIMLYTLSNSCSHHYMYSMFMPL